METVIKQFITTGEIREQCVKVADKIDKSDFKPDVLIGLTRGGLIPLGYLSYYLNNKNIRILNISIYDDETNEPGNPEKEFSTVYSQISNIVFDHSFDTKFLIIDDLIDTGTTVELVKRVFDKINPENKIKFAVMYKEKNYSGINNDLIYYGSGKPEGWLVFPWDTRDGI